MQNIINNPISPTENQKKAFECWHSFENTAIYTERYYTEHPLLDRLKDYLDKNPKIVSAGELYYRARIIDEVTWKDSMMSVCVKEDDDYKRYLSKTNKFKGLTKAASFVPPDNSIIKEGRANPKYVKYLYMAENPTTAIFEVRPFWTERINLAEIQVVNDMQIADLAYEIETFPKETTELEWLFYYIQCAFARPTNDADLYIPSQIIAANIKKWGFDGIRYNSSLHRGGVNLTIFDSCNCEAISSRDMIIREMSISARTAGLQTIDGKLLCIKDNECRLVDERSFEMTVIPLSK